ncbi:MAG: HAD family phosphatase, partial [Actinomycetota bacterium]
MKAVIVDFGGVLTTSIFDSFGVFCAEYGVDPKHLRSIFGREMYAHDTQNTTPLHQVEIGTMPAEEWEMHLSGMLSEGLDEPLAASGLKERMFAEVRPEPRMVQAVIALRQRGIKTAILSNTWGGGSSIRESLAEMFDEVMLSHELGMRKPQPQIFLHAAELLGIDPADCVFVDDVQVNVDGAQAVGMKGILHSDPDA